MTRTRCEQCSFSIQQNGMSNYIDKTLFYPIHGVLENRKTQNNKMEIELEKCREILLIKCCKLTKNCITELCGTLCNVSA